MQTSYMFWVMDLASTGSASGLWGRALSLSKGRLRKVELPVSQPTTLRTCYLTGQDLERSPALSADYLEAV